MQNYNNNKKLPRCCRYLTNLAGFFNSLTFLPAIWVFPFQLCRSQHLAMLCQHRDVFVPLNILIGHTVLSISRYCLETLLYFLEDPKNNLNLLFYVLRHPCKAILGNDGFYCFCSLKTTALNLFKTFLSSLYCTGGNYLSFSCV